MQDYLVRQPVDEAILRKQSTKQRTERRADTEARSAAVVDPESPILTSVQLAKELGVSPATVHRARRDGRLKGIPHGPQGFAFSRTETLQVGDLRKQVNAVSRAQFEGNRDAGVVEMLERGATVSEITIATKTAIDVVARLRSTWLGIREVEQRETTPPCSGCGLPPHSRVSLCMTCFRQMKRVSKAERAALKGEALPAPNTCTCLGCSETVSTEDAEHLCGHCRRKAKVDVHGGVLVVLLDDVPLRVLSVEETRQLVRQLAHHLPPPELPAIEMSPEATPPAPDLSPRVPVAERLRRLKEEIGAT